MVSSQSIRTLLFLFALVFLLSGCSSGNGAVQTEEALDIGFQDCNLSTPGQPLRLPAQCATLEVPEDPNNPEGRQISLNIAVIPAISRSPAPDPLFFLSGGPGQAATETFPQISTAFDPITQKRDIVLVDQRGTGKSNPLTCPQTEEQALDSDPSDEELRATIEACLAEIEQKADPALYTTPIAMHDLDLVRQALGYGQINLYGVSYGSRAALTYLKLYPDNVRALILDGVVPQDEPLGLEVAADAQRALELIFARCAADEACNQAFPDIAGEFDRLLEQLRQSPVEVSLPDPTTGENRTITFSDAELATVVRLNSYAPETAALLPLMIHRAAAEQDYAPLAAQYLIVVDQLETSINEGMHNSVICSEDIPFITDEAAEQATAGTYLGDLQISQLRKICELWPTGELPEGFKEPVISDVPTLLLSGEADPVTPPENAEQVAEGLPNSLSLVASGLGHNVVFRGCLPRLIEDFIEAGSVDGLDTACVERIQPAPFFLDFTGPTP